MVSLQYLAFCGSPQVLEPKDCFQRIEPLLSLAKTVHVYGG